MAVQHNTPPTTRDYAQTNIQLYGQLRQAGYSLGDTRKIKDAYVLAQQLFSMKFRGSGRPYLAHLIGTASILVKHGAPYDVVIAGLMHAAYESGDFGHGLQRINETKRKMLRVGIGEEIEAIAYNYTVSKWHGAQAGDTAGAIADLSPMDRTTYLVRLANGLENALFDNYSYSGVGKQNSLKSGLPTYIDYAKAAGHVALADELSLCLDAMHSRDIEEDLQDATASYTIVPHSYRQRLRPWLIDRARVCRNALAKRQRPTP
jgi:(p)ppGpp synthase/HD superfamily hydrolase